MNGLFKAELIRREGPWRTVEDVELATLRWVDWWNERRLHGACKDIPPAEFEDLYYRQQSAKPAAWIKAAEPPRKSGRFACIVLALALWLLVPELPIVAAGIALFVASSAVPLMNAPYLTLLSTRVPGPLRGPVLQSIITINNVAGPLGYVVAGPLFDGLGLHAAYWLVAVFATLASANFATALSAAGMLRHEAAPEAVAEELYRIGPSPRS